MIILAMDTSGPVAGVAILEDGRIRYEAMAINRMTHSESIMPMAEEALERTALQKEQLTHLAVTVGPGSFTGLRIGVTAIKAMSHALGIPCIGVDALEATAFGIDSPAEIVCPIQDARVQQVYGAAFRDGQRLMEDCVVKLEEYLNLIAPLGERFLFTGDGVQSYGEQIKSALGDRARFAPAHSAYLRPAAVACLAERDIERAVDYLTLQPLYLRAPQAERERARREAKNG
ncbi:MAG: tRNA (adenosine(37)-N6)-threonylcarbamoyltransferase complex dimerization subunit type 1 TsaB [Clostridia bacterium]|nr:tRNA (adenosine(37)-N6)-threonylcarbamoyltransferase complex dimerization subunit type 1 TsaB [Clostridia bacterium]